MECIRDGGRAKGGEKGGRMDGIVGIEGRRKERDLKRSTIGRI